MPAYPDLGAMGNWHPVASFEEITVLKPQAGLQALTQLSSLRSLNLVSYGGRSQHCLDNSSFVCVKVSTSPRHCDYTANTALRDVHAVVLGICVQVLPQV